MKPHRAFACIALIAASMLLFRSCKKIDYRIVTSKCRIVETIDRTFTYDEWGNPVKVEYKEDPGATGNPTFYFVYNERHQLIAYGGASQHYLTLNALGQPIIDSLIMNYAGQDDRIATRIFYDYYGRIRKTISEFYHSGGEDLPLPHGQDTAHFNYDARGNLIIKGVDVNGNEVTKNYDNKKSIFRTHPVFMFVHQNYSLNNPTPESTTYQYNSDRLPLTYEGTFLEGRGFETGIVYECGAK